METIEELAEECPRCLGTRAVIIYLNGIGGGIPCLKCSYRDRERLDLEDLEKWENTPETKEVLELEN